MVLKPISYIVLMVAKTRTISTTGTNETQYGRGVLVFLVLQDHSEFQCSNKVKFAVYDSTMLKSTETETEEFYNKIPALLQTIHHILV